MSIKITTLSENTASGPGLLAEWGLSILVEADGLNVLLDTGLSVSAAYNALAMGIDLSLVDKIVLSHGHADHTGGLLHILKLMKKQVEVIAHPDIWSTKYSRTFGKNERYAGTPFTQEAAESLGASFNLTRRETWLSKNIVTSGEIPMQTDYEEISPQLYVKENGQLKPDPLRDDQALFIKSDKGLIIICGCAHRGVINTIRHAQKLTGTDSVHAVLGGTHLTGASPQRMNATIAALQEIGIKKLGVSHCTGLPQAAILAHEFEKEFFFNNAGTCIDI